MPYDVHKGVFFIEGDNGQRIGIGTGTPTVVVHVGHGAASFSSDTVGIWTGNTPHCRLEVRNDGKVGVGRKV